MIERRSSRVWKGIFGLFVILFLGVLVSRIRIRPLMDRDSVGDLGFGSSVQLGIGAEWTYLFKRSPTEDEAHHALSGSRLDRVESLKRIGKELELFIEVSDIQDRIKLDQALATSTELQVGSARIKVLPGQTPADPLRFVVIGVREVFVIYSPQVQSLNQIPEEVRSYLGTAQAQ